MNEEEVKDCLIRYFEKRAILGKGNWVVYNPPTKKTSQTGWDLAFSRHNQVLFIEAKFVVCLPYFRKYCFPLGDCA